MNFLKKRLKGHKKGHHDDDDDLDYIPPTPPHPSEIAKIQEQQKDLLTSDHPPSEDPVSLAANRKVKKNTEEWKIFEKLSAKVEETVVKTQNNLEKIKETSAAEEIANRTELEDTELTEEEKFFDQSKSGIVAHDLNSWVPLEKDEEEARLEPSPKQNLPKDSNQGEKKKQPPPKPKPPKPPPPTDQVSSSEDKSKPGQPAIDSSSLLPSVDLDLSHHTSSANPLDDFGFGGEPAPAALNSSEIIFDYENDYLDDPFDTSFVNVTIPESSKKPPTDRKEKVSALISQLSLNKENSNFSSISLNHNNRHRRRESLDLNSVSSFSSSVLRTSSAVPKESFNFDLDLRSETSIGQQSYEIEIPVTSSEPSLQTTQIVEATTNSAILPTASTPLDEADLDLQFFSNKLGRSSNKYGSTTSIASIMSNPFLVDNDYYTPTYGSGATTPFSGTATPRRRNSTNPFEQSPEEEYPINAEASAIAALTEDFRKAIGETTLECPEDSNFESASGISRGSEPFDPFATIHDDYVDSPKRQSLSKTLCAPAENSDHLVDEVFELSHGNTLNNHDHDSILMTNKINIINKEKLISDTDSGPSLLRVSETLGPDYLSDISDSEDHYHSEDDGDDNCAKKSNAFQMDLIEKDKEEPPPKFDPLPTDAVINRKLSKTIPIQADDSSEPGSPEISDKLESALVDPLMDNRTTGSAIPFFDPFSTVIDKDSPSSPKILGFTSGFLDSITKTIQEQSLGEKQDWQESIGTSSKEYRYAPPELNRYSLEEDVPHRSQDMVFTSTSAQETGQITSTSETLTATEITTAADSRENYDVFAGSDSGLAISTSGLDNDPTDSGRDPFDTSELLFEPVQDSVPYTDSAAFDAFSARFDQTNDTVETVEAGFDPFSTNEEGEASKSDKKDNIFDIFDPFASSSTKPPKNTPNRTRITHKSRKDREDEEDDDDDDDEDESDHLKVVIRSKMKPSSDDKLASSGPMPLLPPPPKTPIKAFQDPLTDEEGDKNKKDELDEFEAFFNKETTATTNRAPPEDWPAPGLGEATTKRADSMESPSTPLFDDDTSQPLEEFPAKYQGDGWEMFIRHPAKKKLTGNRYWKKVFVRLSENSVIQLYNNRQDPEPFQELPLQPCYSLSEISSQQYDQYGKIFTIKVQYIFYRERVGVRKGQIAKVMQGQITSVSGLAKLGMPLEHAPQVSQLIKLGSLNYEDVKIFAHQIEDVFFRMIVHRDRALVYKTEEIQLTVVDEFYAESTKTGLVTKQLARVRVFMLAFINGMPTIEIGINDITRQGKEVVGRHDIIPVVTEEWIRLEAVDFHCSVDKDEFEKESRLIKVVPPDACFIELMRFRVRPPKHRELPLQVSANLTLTKAKVELRCEVLVPGCVSRKYGQIPCEDIVIRIHIPECWIYFFRTEKHLRYGSVKSASRRPGKIKGIERFLGTTQNFEPTLLEASAGTAKYEHAFHSLVWRIPRLPKEGQGAYTQQLLVCRLPLSSFDQVPEKFYEYVHIEFTMPATTVSHAVIRSVSVSNENPPEKYVRYVARHEYKTELVISFKENERDICSYDIAAAVPAPSTNYSASTVPVVNNPIDSSEKEEKDKDSDDSD